MRLARLRHELSDEGPLYVDLLDNSADNHQAYCIANLREAEQVLLYLTPGALASPWVQLELRLAMAWRIPIKACGANIGRVAAASGGEEQRMPQLFPHFVEPLDRAVLTRTA
jgi:hypothetical protein